jgi:protease-4
VLFRLIGRLFRLLFYPLLWLRRSRAVPEHGWVALTIDGRVADVVPRRRFWQRRRRPVLSLHGLAALVSELTQDPRVRGLLVTIKSLHGGMASATSLRAQLARVREAGRELVVYLPMGGDTKEVYVATAARRILAGPQAPLTPLGFATTTPYLKGALTKAGLVPEVLARGRYKSAGEQLMRDSMSEPQKEQVGELLDLHYTTLLDALSEGRQVDRERAKAIVDEAPYIAGEGGAGGLVDGVAYDDELKDKLGIAGTKGPADATRYLALRRATRMPPIRRAPVIGVIQVHGAIASPGPLRLGLAADDAILSKIRSARKDRRVRGVILHIDSPGGSALASDRIHHELVQLAKDKPLVACMANVAASGGYYVAAAAHSIVAQPTTITGSIGVVSARFALAPLLGRMGIVPEIMKRGARSDLLSPTRPLTAAERTALEKELDVIYRAFVRVVALGRKKSVEEIERVAEGRVWSGAAAHARGLVDELGGFDLALSVVRKRVGAGAEHLEPVILRAPRRPVPPLDPPAQRAAELLEGVASLLELRGEDVSPLVLALSRDRVLAWADVGGLV